MRREILNDILWVDYGFLNASNQAFLGREKALEEPHASWFPWGEVTCLSWRMIQEVQTWARYKITQQRNEAYKPHQPKEARPLIAPY